MGGRSGGELWGSLKRKRAGGRGVWCFLWDEGMRFGSVRKGTGRASSSVMWIGVSCSQVFRGCFLEGLVAAISCKLVVHTWLLAVVSSSSALS